VGAGEGAVFHRESGVFKTSYTADMALYPLPITKWAAAAFAGLFIVIAPLVLGEYFISILDLILIAIVGEASSLTPPAFRRS